MLSPPVQQPATLKAMVGNGKKAAVSGPGSPGVHLAKPAQTPLRGLQHGFTLAPATVQHF